MKTLQKIRERFYWNNVRSDVEKCCHICDPCAAHKGPRKRTRGRLQLYNVGAPFERIAFDILVHFRDRLNCRRGSSSTRFGVPPQVHSDQGRNFDSAVCKRLCEILAIDKTRTTALHPQSDGMECRSRDQKLFGRDLRLPADLLFSWPPDEPLVPKEYIKKLQARMEEMHHLARERIGMASEKIKTRYDARATGHDFHEGDKVGLWNPKHRKGLSPKL
ncbi:retrovirus-related Pol polyprotein from transposon 412 [Trichonephila clavipes]|nr:retrovirus-related Pol polyprotein from transposon 412 [Trichonephila clavipes]